MVILILFNIIVIQLLKATTTSYTAPAPTSPSPAPTSPAIHHQESALHLLNISNHNHFSQDDTNQLAAKTTFNLSDYFSANTSSTFSSTFILSSIELLELIGNFISYNINGSVWLNEMKKIFFSNKVKIIYFLLFLIIILTTILSFFTFLIYKISKGYKKEYKLV